MAWPYVDRRLSPQRKIGVVLKYDLPDAEFGGGALLGWAGKMQMHAHTKRRKDAMQ